MTSRETPATPSARPASGGTSGLVIAIAAYALWGTFPLYFLLLAPAGPFEVVGFRIALALLVCVILLTVLRRWRPVITLLRDRRSALLMALAGLLIYVNWTVYVLATLTDRVLEGSLGYFINPVFTVLLGAILLRERVRVAQWVAIAIAGGAILVIAIGYGTFPWIAVTLALSFGLYGLVKNRVGARVDALSGLTVETLALTPLAIAQLAIIAATTGLVTGSAGPTQAVAMGLAGLVTAVPLLMFAAAARRIPLVSIGLTQFLTPIMQFVLGVAVLQEPMPLERWVGFALVWVAVVVLAVDMVLAARRGRRADAGSAVAEPGM